MSAMAAIILVIFALLILAPALAAWSLRSGAPVDLDSHPSRIVEFPSRQKIERQPTDHKETDAA